MLYFLQEGCSLFYPKMIGHFLPQEGKKKISRFSEFESIIVLYEFY